jgi:hypothetical protein
MSKHKQQSLQYYAQYALTIYVIFLCVFQFLISVLWINYVVTFPVDSSYLVFMCEQKLPLLPWSLFTVTLLLAVSLLIFVLCQVRIPLRYRKWPVIAMYAILLVSSIVGLFQGLYYQYGRESVLKKELEDEKAFLGREKSVEERTSSRYRIRYYSYLLYGQQSTECIGYLSPRGLQWSGDGKQGFVFHLSEKPWEWDKVYVSYPKGMKIPSDAGRKIIIEGKPRFVRGISPSIKGGYVLIEYFDLEKWGYAEGG